MIYKNKINKSNTTYNKFIERKTSSWVLCNICLQVLWIFVNENLVIEEVSSV
jgi:hypothetical protein